MAKDELEGMSAAQAAKMFPYTTEELIADAVSRNPEHNTPFAIRRRRALASAESNPDASAALEQALYEHLVRAIGGDPDELMPGNKPRYTINEETGDVKDHQEGIVHRFQHAGDANGTQPTGEQADAPVGGSATGAGNGGTAGDADGQAAGQRVLPDPGAPELVGGASESRGSMVEAGAAQVIEEVVRAAGFQDYSGDAGSTGEPVPCEDHPWPEPLEEETRCPVCKMTFKEWALS